MRERAAVPDVPTSLCCVPALGRTGVGRAPGEGRGAEAAPPCWAVPFPGGSSAQPAPRPVGRLPPPRPKCHPQNSLLPILHPKADTASHFVWLWEGRGRCGVLSDLQWYTSGGGAVTLLFLLFFGGGWGGSGGDPYLILFTSHSAPRRRIKPPPELSNRAKAG